MWTFVDLNHSHCLTTFDSSVNKLGIAIIDRVHPFNLLSAEALRVNHTTKHEWLVDFFESGRVTELTLPVSAPDD